MYQPRGLASCCDEVGPKGHQRARLLDAKDTWARQRDAALAGDPGQLRSERNVFVGQGDRVDILRDGLERLIDLSRRNELLLDQLDAKFRRDCLHGGEHGERGAGLRIVGKVDSLDLRVELVEPFEAFRLATVERNPGDSPTRLTEAGDELILHRIGAEQKDDWNTGVGERLLRCPRGWGGECENEIDLGIAQTPDRRLNICQILKRAVVDIGHILALDVASSASVLLKLAIMGSVLPMV